MAGGFTFGTAQTAGSSGFSFGATTASGATTTQNAASTSLSFGTPAAQTNPGTVTFGQQQPASTGLQFETPQQQTTATSLSLGTAPASTSQSVSFNFNPPQQGQQQTSTLGSALGQQPALHTAASSTGFAPGGTTSKQNAAFQIAKPTTTTLSSGLSLAQPTSTTQVKVTGATVTFNVGNTAASLGGGLAVAQPTPADAEHTLGDPGATTNTTSTATGLFSSLSTTATTTQPTSILSVPVPSASTGLGGIDPKTTSGASVTGTTSKAGENKAVKETPILNEIQVTVTDFKKYVKNQKTVRENIARMSSTPLFKVQEEVTNLRQLLSLVSNGLQRNSVAIEKLKQDSAEELKHVEIAHRTKETPLGLQYEHTAPTEYFQHLANNFESQMMFFRQQIEEMENYLNSLSLGVTLTPQEVSQILTKLHETFIALAGQLRIVHEAVQVQKDHYLNYRRIFLADNTDVFEKRRKAKQITTSSVTVTIGPTPFTAPSSAAIMAMASTLSRGQQTTGLGLNTAGFGAGQLIGFGSTGTTTSTGGLLGGTSGIGFGLSSGFGQKPATTTQSTGFGPSFNLGSTSTGLFGTGSSQPASTQTGGSSGFGLGGVTAFGTQNTSGQSSFQLQNPPPGSKRGKKA